MIQHRAVLLPLFAALTLAWVNTPECSANSNCFLVKKHDKTTYVYVPGYGPGRSHFVHAHSTATNKLIEVNKVWTYDDKDDNGDVTFYRIGVGCNHYCSCGRRHCHGCVYQWYVWMSIPQPRIHAQTGELKYMYPGHVVRTDIEAVWERFGKSEYRENLTPAESGPPKARKQLSDWYVHVSPKSFDESLLYNFGFSDGLVDITPGMRLRVDFSIWNTPRPAPDAVREPKNVIEYARYDGYVGTGTSYFDVVQSGEYVVFTSYVGLMNKLGIPSVRSRTPSVDPSKGELYQADLVGSVVDINRADDTNRCFWRLRFPRFFQSSRDIAGDPKNYVLLLGASDASYLTDAECHRVAEEVVTWHDKATGEDNIVLHGIRGRSVIIPMIKIRSGQSQESIEVGTTLGHVADTLDGPLENRRPQLKRIHRGRDVPVVFDENTPALLELPLLKGDQIQW